MAGELRFVLGVSDAIATAAAVSDARELQRLVSIAAELVASQNSYLIRKLGRRRIPPLYSSGVLYRQDPPEWDSSMPGGARFLYMPTADEIVRQGWTDCKGAVPYRLADLRLENPHLNYGVHTYVRRNGRDLMVHLQVSMPTGEIEDPSRLLQQ